MTASDAVNTRCPDCDHELTKSQHFLGVFFCEQLVVRVIETRIKETRILRTDGDWLVVLDGV